MGRAPGAYSDFEIIRGDLQQEICEWLNYIGIFFHTRNRKLGISIQNQDQKINKN